VAASHVSTRMSRLFDALILFVVISGGVVAGLFVASRAGLASFGQGHDPSIDKLPNSSLLSVGKEFAPPEIVDDKNRPISLQSALRHKKTLIGIVSEGCDACRAFVEAFAADDNRLDGNYQVILLSNTPEYFRDSWDLATYAVSMDFLLEEQIHAFPTLVAVDENAVVRWVSSGFIPQINAEFVKENL
jgi:thiol-disulfide isomerase/thioredoxin